MVAVGFFGAFERLENFRKHTGLFFGVLSVLISSVPAEPCRAQSVPRTSISALGRPIFIDPVRERPEDFDPLHNDRRRIPLPGETQLPSGITFHSSCRRALPSFHSLQAQITLRGHIDRLTTDIMACGTRYQNLAPYLRQAMTSLRRALIYCVARPSNEFNDTYGINFVHPLVAFHPRLSPQENQELAGLQSSHQAPVILLTQDIVEDLISHDPLFYGRGNPVHKLLHEVLHSTEANNRENHQFGFDSLSVQPGGSRFHSAEDVCSPFHILSDRINVIASLCTGQQGLFVNERGIQEYFAEKRGGLSSCCRATFSSIFSDQALFSTVLRSRDLSTTQADRLCTQIERDGQCLTRWRREDSSSSNSVSTQLASLRGSIELREFETLFASRLSGMLRLQDFLIPKEFFDLFPEFSVWRDRVTPGSCFHALFYVTPRGDLSMRPFLTSRQPRSEYSRRFASVLFRSLPRALVDAQRCHLEAPQVLVELSDIVRRSQELTESMLTRAILNRARGQAEPSSINPLRLGEAEPDLFQRWHRVLGSDLDRYTATWARHAPASPLRECEE